MGHAMIVDGETQMLASMTDPEQDDPERMDEIVRLCEELFPRVLPDGWHVIDEYANAARWRRRDKLMVIGEVAVYDGKLWLHVSCSYPNRLPGWLELRAVKDLFVGKQRKAVQVMPGEAEYVNIHPYVLHLWAPLEGDPLPDFRRRDGGI